MKVRFWTHIYNPPMYWDGKNQPGLMASSIPPVDRKGPDSIRLSFEVEIPDDLIKRQDIEVQSGAVEIE